MTTTASASSILVETYLGNLVLDTFPDTPTVACNFTKLAKIGYYHNNLFFEVVSRKWAKTGDQTGTGQGGTSLQGLIANKNNNNEAKLMIPDMEKQASIAHWHGEGLVVMNSSSSITSTFSFLLSDASKFNDIQQSHIAFARVVEGLETLRSLSANSFEDKTGGGGTSRPLADIRIRAMFVLLDPFDDPPGMDTITRFDLDRYAPAVETVEERNSCLDQIVGKEDEDASQVQSREAETNAIKLEILGDIRSANVKPPENILFVCKLNPVTKSDDLKLIFSRFGDVLDCEVIRDHKTHDSLCYAFVEFSSRAQCEEAYKKMQNVVVDERRIRVDFSQSSKSRPGRWGGGGGRHQGRSTGGTSKPVEATSLSSSSSSSSHDHDDKTHDHNKKKKKTHKKHHHKHKRSKHDHE